MARQRDAAREVGVRGRVRPAGTTSLVSTRSLNERLHFGGKCAVKNHSAIRRVLALLLAVGASLALLAVGSGSATAAPYPPTDNCSTAPASLGTGNQSDACGRGTDDDRDSRDPNQRRVETQTANTGFATLTATLIAAALLVGGGALVVAGRRRRHS